MGIWIVSTNLNRKKVLVFSIGLMVLVLALIFFKYFELIRQTSLFILSFLGLNIFLPALDIVAPAGISFFTFQAITYLTWRYKNPNEKVSVIDTTLYLSFWPTLFAGPIFRAQDFFKQLSGPNVGSPIQVSKAIYFILLGLLQKLVFANWLQNAFVDNAFGYPDAQNFISVFSAVLGYSLQIFLDFSGYTLIVTGLGFLLGYELPINFRQPYLAINLQDFWRRWHISLSTFIRDYVYIPLGGNRKGFVREQLNLFIAMVLSGIWHGASYTFILWGMLHGLGAIFLNTVHRFGGIYIPKVLSRIFTLLFVGFAWIFFRSSTFDDALTLISSAFNFKYAFNLNLLALIFFTVLFFISSVNAQKIQDYFVNLISSFGTITLIAFISIFSFMLVLLGPSGVPNFIYYRF
jgi:D-alanyl-lipoteichoic acid acyltransferase DltB (MBOAT superfamily)